jgi:anti-sigma regulatory factor (Ser/Thr protein kinase)
MQYEENETVVEPGDTVLFYSDGIVEAHNPQREMFSFGRLQELVAGHGGGTPLIDFLLAELGRFTGAGWEQEDDVTMVTLQRVEAARPALADPAAVWRTLATFSWPSEPGNERLAMAQVAESVQSLNVEPARLERLKTGVAEATMNAMEHGNKFNPAVPVEFVVRASDQALSVRITDQGGGQPIPEAAVPDLAAKLAGAQTPRGWGLFLIEKMVDEMHVSADDKTHTIELIMYLKGRDDGHQTA